MRKLIALLSIVLFMASCHTKRHTVKSETMINTVSELNTSKNELSKTHIQAVSLIAENVTETDSTVIEETITELSKPDSLGNQHPEKIINRKITSGKNKETKFVENSQLKLTAEDNVSETENQVAEQELSNETRSNAKIKKSQSWKLIAAIILLAVIGLLAWSRFFKQLTNRFNFF